LVCTYLYVNQDQLIFHPVKLDSDYSYSFTQSFKEYNIKLSHADSINAVLFKTDTLAKGLIFFLHGNAGNVTDWENAAKSHTDFGYDFFVVDYPGFGKSSGHVTNEQQILNAVKIAFDTIAKEYEDRKIIIIGFSIGTGPAAWLASQRPANALILLAPYYQFTDLVLKNYPFVPRIISKYKFTTYTLIDKLNAPVYIFHGDEDQIIPYQSSLKLSTHFKPVDKLFILKGQEHNGIIDNQVYLKHIKPILKNL
jgi:uncharacterized protein